MSVSVVKGERLVSCDSCEKAIRDGQSAHCSRCLRRLIDDEVEEAEAESCTDISGENLREWADSAKLRLSITPEVHAALMQAADDIEAGWPK